MKQGSSKYLLVVATVAEVAPVLEMMQKDFSGMVPGAMESLRGTAFDLLVTGPGIVSTTFHTARALASGHYSLVLNAGVAGSFDPEIEQGSLLNVQRDRFSDFGVETHDGFIPGEKLPFSLLDRLPYHEGWLILSAPAKYQPAGLEICSAITSDTVHTTEASVQYLRDLFQPDIESMEGAAFTFTCLQSGIPCIQIRSVSNMVGPHNEANWQLELAIASLNTFLKEYLDETR